MTTTQARDDEPLVLHSMNVGGNLHFASRYLNDHDLAPYVLVMQYGTGDYTVVVLRLPLSEKLNLQSKGTI
jgi:hypothetical protein